MKIRRLDTADPTEARCFVQFPNQLYRSCPQWVPLPLSDGLVQLDRSGAYFQHSEADFFVAENKGQIAGRIAVLENRLYNDFHHSRHAFFYLFDTIEDFAVAQGLFEAATAWSRARGLNKLVGPKGFIPFDGIGMLYRGFDHPPAMGIPYNYDYYNRFIEQLGFAKEIDFASFYLDPHTFELPRRISRIAERVKKRRKLRVKTFASRAEVRRWIPKVVETYNQVFVNNWEYVPVTPAEAEELAGRMLQIIDPKLIKFILNEQDELVGFLLVFLDISAALQQTGGKLWPLGWLKLLLALKTTRWLNVNGMGIRQEYQGLGGNAILYDELVKTLRGSRFEHVDLVQVADNVDRMRADLETLGGVPYKTHRVYYRDL